MARKSTKPKPDSDGYLRTGIYKKYVGKPKPEHQLTVEKAEAWVEASNSPATNDLARLRDWLATIILPHVEGPLNETEPMQANGQTYRYLDFGDGPRRYCDKVELQQQEQCIISVFQDAISAIDEIRLIEMYLGPDGLTHLLFRATFRLGQLCERIGVRPFEPLVASGRKATIERPQAMRQAKVEADKINRGDKHQRANEAIKWARDKFPTASEDNKISFLKAKAAEHLEINVGTLNRWLRNAK